MQKDFAQEHADAANGCGDNNTNYTTVQSDDTSVQSDYTSIKSDDTSLNSDKTSYDADVSTVQQDIQTVQSDWASLQQAVANNTSGTPAAYTQHDIDNAIGNAQKAMSKANTTWQSAQQTATQYDNEAGALSKQADAIPGNMHCS